MPTVISFLSEKGGSGKTTDATNIACAFARYGNDGDDCLLIDADPQGSSRNWNDANHGQMLPVIGLDRDTLAVDLRAISHGFEYVVIDGAPRIAKTTAAAIRVSHLVVIPVQPSPYDIWACEDLVNLIKARQEVSDGNPQACFLISRVIKGTKIGKEIYDELARYELPILNSFTTQRVAYPTSARKGLSVYQSGDKEAIKEIDAIYNEILARLNHL
jgi:chromosome partitioning protein